MLVLCNNVSQFFLLIVCIGILFKRSYEVPLISSVGLMPGSFVDTCQLFMIDKSQSPPPYLSVVYTYPPAVTFLPTAVVSVKNLQWEGQLLFEYTYFPAQPTYVAIRLTRYQTVNNLTNYLYKIRFAIGLFQNQYYSFVNQDFTFLETSTSLVPQNITISSVGVNTMVSSIWVLMGYQDKIFPGFVPGANVPLVTVFLKDVINITNNNGASGYMIKKIVFRLAQLNHIVMYDMGAYYAIITYDVICNISQCGVGLNLIQATYPQRVFHGLYALQAISSVGQNASFYVQLTNRYSSYVVPYTYFVIRFYSICPITQKYWGHFYGQCFSQCPNRTYPYQQFNYHKYYCNSCANQCFRCDQLHTNCTECFDQFLLVIDNPIINTHTCICPFGQYGTHPNCISCNTTIPFCVSCTSGTNCLQCDAGLIYNPLPNACQCPPSRQPLLNNFTYINQLNVNVTVRKLRCISKRVVENCSNLVVTTTPPIGMNLLAYGQTCSCVTGGQYIANKCI